MLQRTGYDQMDGVRESDMYKFEYSNSSNLFLIEQMHDEIINKIECNSSNLILKFDELHFKHFDSFFDRAEMIFSGFDDIYSDVSIELYKMDGVKIKNGEKLYLDDFYNKFQDEKVNFEVLDMFVGYKSFLICGNSSKAKSPGYNKFRLTINSKTLNYIFY